MNVNLPVAVFWCHCYLRQNRFALSSVWNSVLSLMKIKVSNIWNHCQPIYNQVKLSPKFWVIIIIKVDLLWHSPSSLRPAIDICEYFRSCRAYQYQKITVCILWPWIYKILVNISDYSQLYQIPPAYVLFFPSIVSRTSSRIYTFVVFNNRFFFTSSLPKLLLHRALALIVCYTVWLFQSSDFIFK